MDPDWTSCSMLSSDVPIASGRSTGHSAQYVSLTARLSVIPMFLMAAQIINIHLAFGGYSSHLHGHILQLQQDQWPKHGPWRQFGPGYQDGITAIDSLVTPFSIGYNIPSLAFSPISPPYIPSFLSFHHIFIHHSGACGRFLVSSGLSELAGLGCVLEFFVGDYCRPASLVCPQHLWWNTQ